MGIGWGGRSLENNEFCSGYVEFEGVCGMFKWR